MEIIKELNHHLYLLDELRKMYPEEEDVSFADTLEGETNLHEMLVKIIYSADDDAAIIAGIDLRISTMNARKDRLKRRIERSRELVADVMQRAGIIRLTPPDMTVSVSKRPPKVLIIDENQIPKAYFTPAPPPPDKLDKSALKEALEDGIEVPGAVLSNGGFGITVRRT